MELILGTVGVFFDACRLQEPNMEGSSRHFGVCTKVLRRVLAAAGALFSLWRPVANNVDVCFHFGEMLGAKSSTVRTLTSSGSWQSHLGPPSAPSYLKVAIVDDIWGSLWGHFGAHFGDCRRLF